MLRAQPLVKPLPKDLSLKDQVVVITGATGGLGLETARQALALHARTVVLACRNAVKAEDVKTQLLADPAVRKLNPPADAIKIMAADMADPKSVRSFAAAVRAEVPRIDVLFLNAGLGFLPGYQTAPSGHELTLEVNFLSNVLLLAELLPHLQASAKAKGSAVRVMWVGSRTYVSLSTLLAAKGGKPVRDGETVLQRLDDKKRYAHINQYGDTKLLCRLWFSRLADRLDPKQIVINMMCPGNVDTDFTSHAALLWRIAAKLIKLMAARPVEQGGWMMLWAAVVMGPESHGKFIGDQDVMEPEAFLVSPEGKKLSERTWADTAAEIGKLTTLPPEMTA